MEGAIAKWYARLTQKSLAEFQLLARRVADELPPGASVLEVAPGPGYFAIELASLGDYRVTGLDISKTFVDIATANAARAKVAAQFQRGDASHMPFDSERFDYLVCRAAFKNFAAPVAALQEMYRVLKPGGRALITRSNVQCPSLGEILSTPSLENRLPYQRTSLDSSSRYLENVPSKCHASSFVKRSA